MLVVIDVVLQINAGRARLRNLLVNHFGSAWLAWREYQRILGWWYLRVPVAYLVAGGFFNVISRWASQPVAGWSSVFFSLMLAMAVASSVRLIPLRRQDEPPQDWKDLESALYGE